MRAGLRACVRVCVNICTYIFKTLHDLAPDYMNGAIVRKTSTRVLRSSIDAMLLMVTVSKRTIRPGSVAVTYRHNKCGIA